MSVRRIKAGTTDVSVTIRIVDSTDGTPETGVVFNTSGIDLWYRREGAVSTDITEADLATPALTDAHGDGGFLHINDGWYRLDLPDAACAAGVTGVQIGGTVTGMVVLAPYIELVAYDPYDTVRLGLTALPNAAADAAGGLPVSDAGGLDLDAKLANTNEVTAARMGALTDWIDGGRLDLLLDAILDDTDLIDDATSGLAKIATDVAAALADTADMQPKLGTPAADVSADIAAIKTVADAVKAVTDLLNAAQTEPTGVPAANATPLVKLAILYMMARNKVTVTATKKTFFDDGDAAEFEKDVSDDGTTYTESEANAI